MLPVDALVPAIRESLAAHPRLVLVAPPGAGKTTRVPRALLGEPWLAGRKIIMLEPRRLAARAAARRIATELGDSVGGIVGHRVHLDTVVSTRTRLEVVTEGVLTRMLQSDATLGDAGAVIFDEFHERSLHADIGLALSMYAQAVVRPELRIIVMSATIDGRDMARALDAPLLESEGRLFPVTTLHRPLRDRERPDDAAARVTHEALQSHDGDVLVFLPGAAEIRSVHDSLDARIGAASVLNTTRILDLYGDLPADAQDEAIAPSPAGRRKVVLATNIAETSLTIEGVRIVVDSGLARVPRFSPRTGLTRLETARISRASADQRRGRAGRVAPGVCYRIWAEGDDAQLAPRSVPEILDADLAPLALELAVAGIGDPSELTWIDQPPAGALQQARELLARLGALDDGGRITPHGKLMAALGAHPRLAHMLVRAAEIGKADVACDLAALLLNRDPIRMSRSEGMHDADLQLRIDALRTGKSHGDVHVDHHAIRHLREESRRWRQRVDAIRVQRAQSTVGNDDANGVVLAFAYPDRIARKRAGHDGRFLLANGTGARFEHAQPLGGEEWLVIAETDGRVPESRIFLAARAGLDALLAHRAATLEASDVVRWDDRAERVAATRRTTLGAIVVREHPLRDPPAEMIQGVLFAEIRRRGIASLPWHEGSTRLRERLAFLHAHDDTWPDVSDEALLETIDSWLAPALLDVHSFEGIARADLAGAVLSTLSWQQRAALDKLAPTHIDVPSGSRISVDYSDVNAPALAVRLQELFGLAANPRVLDGRVPLTLHLLSPAHRPVQVTKDLAAFWKGSYAEVRKEMRGRYPKHDWPEDPSTALPSRGRPRRST